MKKIFIIIMGSIFYAGTALSMDVALLSKKISEDAAVANHEFASFLETYKEQESNIVHNGPIVAKTFQDYQGCSKKSFRDMQHKKQRYMLMRAGLRLNTKKRTINHDDDGIPHKRLKTDLESQYDLLDFANACGRKQKSSVDTI